MMTCCCAAVLLALTLGGLIDWLSTQWSRVFDPQGCGTAPRSSQPWWC